MSQHQGDMARRERSTDLVSRPDSTISPIVPMPQTVMPESQPLPGYCYPCCPRLCGGHGLPQEAAAGCCSSVNDGNGAVIRAAPISLADAVVHAIGSVFPSRGVRHKKGSC